MNFSSIIAGNIVYRSLNIIAGILLTLLLTRLMTVEGYGILSLMIANASVFSLVSCLGSESGITYHYASGSLQRGKIFAIVYIVIFFQLALLGITESIHHYITGSYWLVKGKEMKFLLWGMVYLFSITLIDKYTAFFYGSHRYTLCNKIIFAGNLLALLAFGWLFFYYDVRDVVFYLEIFIGTTFLQALFLLLAFHLSDRSSWFVATEKKDWKIFFSYSFIVFITNVIQFLAYRVDYWLVDYYRGNEALGLYSLAVKLGQLFWVLPILFAGIIFPQASDKENEQSEARLKVLTRISVTFLFIAELIALALASLLIPFLFGEAYRQTVTAFIYLLPGIFLFSIDILLAAWFAGKNRLNVNLTGSIMCFLVVLVLDLWLIPRRGIQGAAIASSIAYSFAGLYFIWKFTGFRKNEMAEILLIKSKDLAAVTGFLKKIFRS